MKKIKVYVMHMTNANTGYPIDIIMKNRESLEKFKADAEKDKRYYTQEIQEVEAESVSLDNTVYATNIYDNIGCRRTININMSDFTYLEFIEEELGITSKREFDKRYEEYLKSKSN